MKRIFFILFISALAVSCKKETTEPEETKDYLTKTTKISGTDTTITDYEYNAKKQLSKVIYSDKKYTKIEYYESGEVAIVDSYLERHDEKLRRRIVFTYDKSNIIKSAVFKTYINSLLDDSETWNYKVDSNRVVEIETGNNQGSPILIKYDINGNIAEVNDQVNGAITKYTYNDKPSKLINSHINFYLGVGAFNEDELLSAELYNANDCIKVERSGTVTEYTPEYNEKNMLTSSLIKDNSAGNLVEGKINFEFTAK